jgi:hypothetical protein
VPISIFPTHPQNLERSFYTKMCGCPIWCSNLKLQEMTTIPDYLELLLPKARRGSKPRCHLLTHGSAEDVAERLTMLVKPWGRVDPNDQWMPKGFNDLKEAQLGKATRLLNDECCAALRSWWLAVPGPRANTPNWDIASTCSIDGRKGLLLIEAKAHDEELRFEEAGKSLKPSARENSRRNHEQIGACIQAASLNLTRGTGLPWALSPDRRYQMANRFAWAWKLTDLGIPVILEYLGFLEADKMKDRGKPFVSDADWRQLVMTHSEPLFAATVWDRKWRINGQDFIPLIKTAAIPLERPCM